MKSNHSSLVFQLYLSNYFDWAAQASLIVDNTYQSFHVCRVKWKSAISMKF